MTSLNALALTALQIAKIVPGGQTAEAEDQATALARLITLMAELPEYGGGRRLTDVDTAESYEADEDERVICSAGGITITLPTAPSDGARVSVVDVTGAFASSNATLARNYRKIAGSAANATLTAGGTWVYRSDLADWKLVSTLTGASDSPYPADLDLAISHILIERFATDFGVEIDQKLAMRIGDYKAMVSARYTRLRKRNTRADLPGGLNRNFWGNY